MKRPRCKNTFRRCFNNNCIKLNKNKSYNKKRCSLGTRKCADRNCHIYKKFFSFKRKSSRIRSPRRSRSPSPSPRRSHIYTRRNSRRIRQTHDDWDDSYTHQPIGHDIGHASGFQRGYNGNVPYSFKPHYESPQSRRRVLNHQMDINEVEPSSFKPHYESPPRKIGYAHHQMDINEVEPSSYRLREPITKFISPKRKLKKKSEYDLDDFKKSSSSSSKKQKPLKYKFVGKINQNKRQTLDDWSMSDNSKSF